MASGDRTSISNVVVNVPANTIDLINYAGATHSVMLPAGKYPAQKHTLHISVLGGEKTTVTRVMIKLSRAQLINAGMDLRNSSLIGLEIDVLPEISQGKASI
ncbi:hypothetical protein PQI07_09105 [Methylobacterium sp. 092160098-2]|uniref:hypothetical protein n=1 Tax=Methylobacterium sp. 092160098-2 TaxID=3025129 RepID=UPI002381A661|nr:hypothetical protein [Methylobacterium sp. 092160098-2]MDE4910856.1 hypothetical protein [Methylobacterium sp. 092160098-2]